MSTSFSSLRNKMSPKSIKRAKIKSQCILEQTYLKIKDENKQLKVALAKTHRFLKSMKRLKIWELNEPYAVLELLSETYAACLSDRYGVEAYKEWKKMGEALVEVGGMGVVNDAKYRVVIEAARKYKTKMDTILESGSYKSIFTSAFVHDMKYDGLNIEKEGKDLDEALKALDEEEL